MWKLIITTVAFSVFGVSLLLFQDPEFRVWSDSSGQFQVTAAFVELVDGEVRLRLEDGEEITVSLDRLSGADRAYARRAARPKVENPKAEKQEQQQNGDEAMPAEPARESHSTSPADWSQWRGPNRDGISRETGLLDSWPDDGPPLSYQINGLGSGFSSVVISNGRLFTMGQFGNETRLVARDANTGQPLWQTAVGRGGDAPNSTPTVDGDLVFAISHAGDMLCANAEAGQEIWRVNFPRDFGGRMMSQWGYSESPLVDGDRVIVTPGGTQAMMAALDKKTGKVAWRTPLADNVGPAGQDGAGYSSIVISEARGTRQYIQLVGRGLISVEAKSGRLLWGYNRVANTTANVPTPIVSGDYVFCSSGYDDGGSALLQVVGSRGQITAQEMWYKPSRELQNHHGGMILVGEQVYMGHGHNNGFPVCFDLRTGRERWRPGRGPGTGSAAITCVDGHLYFRYENGMMALIRASPDNFQLQGKFRLPIHNAQSWPHPVVAQSHLYLRCQDDLVCYDLRRSE